MLGRGVRELGEGAVATGAVVGAPHAGGRVEQRALIVGFDAVGPEAGAIMPCEAQIGVGNAADAAIAAAGTGIVFGDQGAGSARSSGGEAGGAAGGASGAGGAGSSAQLALQAELLKASPVACFSGGLPLLASLFTFLILPSSSLTDLVQRFHVLLPPGFLFLGGFGKFYNGVDSSALAFARDEPFRWVQGRVVGGKGDDAADGGVSVNAVDGSGRFGGALRRGFSGRDGRVVGCVAGVKGAGGV